MTFERTLCRDRDGNELVSIRDTDGKRYELRPGLKALHRGMWKITRAEAFACVRQFGRIHRFINRSAAPPLLFHKTLTHMRRTERVE